MINRKVFSKFFQILTVFLVHSFLLQGQEAGKILFNEDWQFHRGNMELEAAEAGAQGEWRPVDLPHDWSVEGPFDKQWASGTGYLPGGMGWYRKTFDIQDWKKNHRYAIYFDGIYKNSEVWINGHFLGKRPNGFIPFQYDLTTYLNPTGNTIVVKVDHSDYADSRYYTGSGIYRNVYLITQQNHHFSQWGVFFKTPEIKERSAMAEIEIRFENHEGQHREVQIRSILKEANGSLVARSEKQFVSKAGQENHALLNFEIKDPKRWSTVSPYLYNLTLELVANGKIMDHWESKVGVRDFYFDPDKGFFLNGGNMLLKGVCIHHDAGALGAAVPKEVWAKRLQTLKELGCNAIRMSHYPHQDYIYDLCDEMGFLVQDEAFDEWEVGKNKWIEGWNVGTPGNDGYHSDFAQWGKKDMGDMVHRNRNHPSIIMWSIGNEIDYPNDPYSHPILDEGNNPQIYGKGYQKNSPPASRLGELAIGLVKVAKSFDTTRPITAALAGVTMSNYTDYPSALDIVGYNYQERRYVEDHKAFPKRVIYGSENGDSLEAWWAVTDNEYIASQFLWTAFDFLGEARRWPVRSSGAGILDLAGKPKPDFYFRKSLWNDEPMVYIAVRDNDPNAGRRNPLLPTWTGDKGAPKSVVCYTNTEEVELFFNGTSLGKQNGNYKENKEIGWTLDFESGELLAKGYNDGKVVAMYSLTTPGALAKVQLTTDKTSFGTDKGTVHLDILLTDENGNRVLDSDHDITVEVNGPAKLLGLESGDLTDTESYMENHKKTYLGQLRGYLQATGQKGDVVIKVKSEILPGTEIIIRNKATNGN